MVEKFKEKFKALIEDYKVTRNENEDFVWWYVQRVMPYNFRYVIAVVLVRLFILILNTRSQRCLFYGSLQL